MQQNIITTDSYGERSVFLLPLPLAILIGVLLLLEPVALYKRIGYENYRSQGELHIPVIYLVLSSIVRVLIRIVITIAVLESCDMDVQNGSVWAYIILTYFFLAEVFLGFIISDRTDRLTLKPNLPVEITAQFCSILLLALIAAYFEKTYIKELLIDTDNSTGMKIFVACLLFLLLYIPSRIIDFYLSWIQQKTLQQKMLYGAIVVIAFVSIVATAFRQ